MNPSNPGPIKTELYATFVCKSLDSFQKPGHSGTKMVIYRPWNCFSVNI
jgi:hypothetical protein